MDEGLDQLQAGVFGAARVWEVRAGMRIAPRCAQVRFGATASPPTVGIFLGLAHLHAAPAHFGFSAAAIAAARGVGSQQGRRVSQKRERAGEEANG